MVETRTVKCAFLANIVMMQNCSYTIEMCMNKKSDPNSNISLIKRHYVEQHVQHIPSTQHVQMFIGYILFLCIISMRFSNFDLNLCAHICFTCVTIIPKH